MEIQESFRGPDRKKKMERADIRKRAEAMIQKHEQYLKNLELSGTDFQMEAAEATQRFNNQLKDFLTANGAEDLYEDLVGFVSGKVSEVVNTKRESSSQN